MATTLAMIQPVCGGPSKCIADGQRFFEAPEQRRAFFERCRQELQMRERRYVVLRGSWSERFAAACQAVKQLLSENRPAATSSAHRKNN